MVKMIIKQLADELFIEKQDEIRVIIREELERFFFTYSQNHPRPYLQTNEVCDLLGCSPNKLRDVCIQYNIKPKKVIGTNYYRRADIDQLMNNL